MIDYKIVYSSRKTLAVEVTKNAEVIVRAPNRTSKAVIVAFVEKHASWIEKHVQKVKERVASEPVLSQNDVEKLRALAEDYIPGRVQYWSEIMNLYPTGVKITCAKTRYGSCSGKNSLCFSLYLMTKPRDFVEYVVVHELAHIKYKNHSKDFHNFVAKFYKLQN